MIFELLGTEYSFISGIYFSILKFNKKNHIGPLTLLVDNRTSDCRHILSPVGLPPPRRPTHITSCRHSDVRLKSQVVDNRTSDSNHKLSTIGRPTHITSCRQWDVQLKSQVVDNRTSNSNQKSLTIGRPTHITNC